MENPNLPQEYHDLFHAVSDTNYPNIVELNSIINIVHRNFPNDLPKSFTVKVDNDSNAFRNDFQHNLNL